MKIALLGIGHMGSWLARELSKEHEVAVYDTDAARMKNIEHVVPLPNLSSLGKWQPNLLINAVTLKETVSAFESTIPYLEEGCIIGDVASIKGDVADYYRRTSFPFVSVHPMFGPTFADMEKVREENAVVIRESCAEGRRIFMDLFARLGCHVFEYTFEEHDKTMAYSLTIPFVSSLIFAACVDAKAVPGTTFKRHMALARNLLSEDDHLLAEILFNPNSIGELNKITSRLEFLKHVNKAKDRDETAAFFARLRENIGE
jgi:prephenate dehydrogenase